MFRKIINHIGDMVFVLKWKIALVLCRTIDRIVKTMEPPQQAHCYEWDSYNAWLDEYEHDMKELKQNFLYFSPNREKYEYPKECPF